VDERNRYGMTSLHWTALNGRADVAKTLLEWGADANARDEYTGGLTPYAIAKLMGYEEVAQTISYHGGTY
jgi:ankyrin repeat protein